jgi:hypothetical protein
MAHKPKPITRLRLHHMVRRPWLYDNLREGLNQLPLPETLRIRRKRMQVPQDVEQLGRLITYGQRMYFSQPEPHDYGLVLRFLGGLYQPQYTGKPFTEQAALDFGALVLHCRAVEAFPVALHVVRLAGELVTRELALLERKPTKQEEQAGIKRLNKFADLQALIFLQEQFHCTPAEVAQLPYADCLVRFLLRKEENAYADRLAEVYRKEHEAKMKHKKK